MSLLPALVCSLAGVALLRGAWQLGGSDGNGRRIALDVAGWGLLAVSVGVWMAAGGPDRGVALAFLAFMLPGLAMIAVAGWQGLRANGNGRRNSRADAVRAAREQDRPPFLRLRQAWIFVLTGPLAAAVAVVLGMALYAGGLALAWHPADVLATVLLFVPLAWTVLAVAASTHWTLWKRSGLVVALGLLGLVVVRVLPGAG